MADSIHDLLCDHNDCGSDAGELLAMLRNC